MKTGKKLGFETADILLWEVLKPNSQANRRNATHAENILWQLLRNSSTGHKIRRQHELKGILPILFA